MRIVGRANEKDRSMSNTEALPVESQLHDYARPQDFMDCFSVEISNRWACETASMQELANLIFSVNVPGADQLMRLRDTIVKPLGLKTSDDLEADGVSGQVGDQQVGDRMGLFRIYSIDEHEIILGEDDTHQDFRVTLLRSPGQPTKLYVATCCQRHNWFGFLYLATILPFHKLIVKGMLDGAAKKISAAGDAPVSGDRAT
jgi:Protein of unknown function (DUF2867)